MIIFMPATIFAFIAYVPFKAQEARIACIFANRAISIPLIFPQKH